MAQDILIVDDDRLALTQYGNEVRAHLNIEPFLAEDPRDALSILHDYPIKVLITDQIMPNMNGVELIRRVRNALHLQIPCIMLTGVPEDFPSDAVHLQFFDLVDKMDARAKLIPSIRKAIQRYDQEESYTSTVPVNRILAEKKSWLKWHPRISVKLLRIISILETYTRDNDWHTDHIAQRGVSYKQKMTIQRKATRSIEYSITAEIVHTLGLKTGKVLSEITSTLQASTTLSGKIQQQEEITILSEQEIEVKDLNDTPAPPNSSRPTLQSREYQTTPVYIRVNCVLEFQCSCCMIPHKFNATLDFPTDRLAMRQIEHFDKGPDKKIYIGFLPGTIQP